MKACRKVKVQGAKLVKCHDGSDRTPACEGFATLDTNCVYCGKNGCADHVNMCRYKIIEDEESSSGKKKYVKCEPESVIGNCPDELEKELEFELNGKEQIDPDVGTR